MIFQRDKKTWENPSEEVYLSPHSCSDGTPQRAGIRELGGGTGSALQASRSCADSLEGVRGAAVF